MATSNSVQQINDTSFMFYPETIISQREASLSTTEISNPYYRIIENTSNNDQ